MDGSVVKARELRLPIRHAPVRLCAYRLQELRLEETHDSGKQSFGIFQATYQGALKQRGSLASSLSAYKLLKWSVQAPVESRTASSIEATTTHVASMRRSSGLSSISFMFYCLR